MSKRLKALQLHLRKSKLESDRAENEFLREEELHKKVSSKRDLVKEIQTAVTKELDLALVPGVAINTDSINAIQSYSVEVKSRLIEMENEVSIQFQKLDASKKLMAKCKLVVRQIEKKIEETTIEVNRERDRKSLNDVEELFTMSHNNQRVGITS